MKGLLYKVKGKNFLTTKRNLETAKCSARLALVAMAEQGFSQYDQRITIEEINEITWDKHLVCTMFVHDEQLFTTDPNGVIIHSQQWRTKNNFLRRAGTVRGASLRK